MSLPNGTAPDPAAFIRANTIIEAPPLVPEIRLHLASEITPIWPALVLTALQLAWQAGRVKTDDPGDCLATFRSNRWIGWTLLAGIVTARLIPSV